MPFNSGLPIGSSKDGKTQETSAANPLPVRLAGTDIQQLLAEAVYQLQLIERHLSDINGQVYTDEDLTE